MWVGALVSNVIGNLLPGPGSLSRTQSFTFHHRVGVGDELVISVKVIEKREPRLVVLETRVVKAGGEIVADGIAEVFTPPKKLVFDELSVPSVLVQRHAQFDRLLEAARRLPPLPTAIVCPHDEPSLLGALQAADAGLIVPLLVGERDLIEQSAEALHRRIDGIELVDVGEAHLAAAHAVSLVHAGKVRAIMKGALHSDTLLEHVVKKEGGLRTERRISHVYVMDTPGLDHPLFISDAAINIAPDLAAKTDIVQNAIDLARACGIERPRVGILSAVETVNPNIPSTIDAAVLSKMAERGQIEGAIVDGPLAMDNAVDVEAARTKGITSLVAGRAEVLIVPNLEAGNMLAKELTFIAHAEAAGLVIGATVPVMLTSRADGARARLVSCAIALLYDDWRRRRRQRGARGRGVDPAESPGIADR
jgi:phosphate butyryltransferase